MYRAVDTHSMNITNTSEVNTMERNEFINGVETCFLIYIAFWFVCLYIKALIWIAIHVFYLLRYLFRLLVRLVKKMMMLFSNLVANFKGE